MSSVPKIEENMDQDGLRRIGSAVRERLEANPHAYRVPTDKAEIHAIGDFASVEECARLRRMIDDRAQPSTVFDLEYSSGYRTSYSGDFDPGDPFVKKISRRIDDLLGMESGWGETIQGQRYLPSQQFQPHHDWFHPGTSYWETEMRRGGQRSYTAMIFLNEVEEGGVTEFTDLRMSMMPRRGVLLCWNNADIDGIPNPWTIHAGRPVIRGTKYVITKWYRTRRWF